MAGHSKWAKVEHFEGAIDAKRAPNQLIEVLEEHDDVKEVFSNMDHPGEAVKV
jgi:transcriptional/translational regulatory protein YebC/TACO1